MTFAEIKPLEKLLEFLSQDHLYARELKAIRVKTPDKWFISKVAEFTVKYLRTTTDQNLFAWKQIHAPSEAEEKRVFDFFVVYGAAFVAKRFQIRISEAL